MDNRFFRSTLLHRFLDPFTPLPWRHTSRSVDSGEHSKYSSQPTSSYRQNRMSAMLADRRPQGREHLRPRSHDRGRLVFSGTPLCRQIEPLKADALIEEWRREWAKGLVPRVDEKGGPSFNESFGRFLQARYQRLFSETRPAFLERNMRMCREAAKMVGFEGEVLSNG
jgi:hypothetical protein